MPNLKLQSSCRRAQLLGWTQQVTVTHPTDSSFTSLDHPPWYGYLMAWQVLTEVGGVRGVWRKSHGRPPEVEALNKKEDLQRYTSIPSMTVPNRLDSSMVYFLTTPLLILWHCPLIKAGY